MKALRLRWWVILGLAVLAIGLLLSHASCWGRRPTEPRVSRVDTVPDKVILQQKPDTAPSLPQRIVKRRVPTHIAVSQGTPDTALARKYADAVMAASRWRDSVAKLTAARQESHDTTPLVLPPKPRAVLVPAWANYDGSTLTYGLTRSDGSVLVATARVKPRWELYSGQDRFSDSIPIIRADRWFVRYARRAPKCLVKGTVLGGLTALFVGNSDRLAKALIVGGTAAGLCVAD